MFPTSVRNQGTSRDSADSIAPLQTKPSPLQTDRSHFGLLSRSRPHSAFHVAVVELPRVRPEEIGWHPNHSQLPKPEQGHRDSSDCDPPRRRGAWHPRRRLSFLRVRPFLGVYSVNNPPRYYPPDCLLHTQQTLRMAPYAPRRRRRPCLVRLGHETRYGRP